jgi:hypothetical protein
MHDRPASIAERVQQHAHLSKHRRCARDLKRPAVQHVALGVDRYQRRRREVRGRVRIAHSRCSLTGLCSGECRAASGDCPTGARSAATGIRLVLPDWMIRSATEQDIAPVLSLWVTAGGPPSVSDTHEGLSRLLAADRDALLLAESDGVVIGSLIAVWDGW